MGVSAQYKRSITANSAIVQAVRKAGFTNVSRADLRDAALKLWTVYTTDAPPQDAPKNVLDAVQRKLADAGIMFRGYGVDGRGKYLVIEFGLVDLKEKAR